MIEIVGRRVQVTGAGKDVEQCAAAAIAQMKELEDFMARHRGPKKGTVDLAVVRTEKYFMPMFSTFSIHVSRCSDLKKE